MGKEDKVLDEIKRYNKILLEHMEHQVKTVAEQYGSVKEEIGLLRNSMEKRFDVVEMAVMENSKQIKELKTGQERLEAGQEKLETGQEKLEVGQERLETGQERLEQKLDTKLTEHERRIEEIEEKICI